MWISKKRFEDLELQVHFLKEKVNGRSSTETFIRNEPKDIPLRKGFNSLLKYLGIEFIDEQIEPAKFVKVKK